MDETIPQISELLAAQIKAASLEAEVFTLRAQTELTRLTTVRDELVEQARTEVGAPADHVVNWQTRRFQAPV